MVFKNVLRLFAAVGLALAAHGQNALIVTPVPSDPLELATGAIQTAASDEARNAAVTLLNRARASYNLRSAKLAYDLSVSFTVNSGGKTSYDGAWQMEDVFDPKQGGRWTAKSGDAYSVTQISSSAGLFGDGAAQYLPLRLQEARAALFDPIPPLRNPASATIRIAAAVYNGTPVTCILLSEGARLATPANGRAWEESEDCIDPQAGLLQTHSPAPGRYFAYDYTDAPQFAGHILPRRVLVTEAGNTITQVSVDDLLPGQTGDATLFTPSERMTSSGKPIAMSGAQKVTRLPAKQAPAGAVIQPVIVFGLVTPSGQLVEAHSLQPSDPNSQAALQMAKKLRFSQPTAAEAHAQQHFVFIIATFFSSR